MRTFGKLSIYLLVIGSAAVSSFITYLSFENRLPNWCVSLAIINVITTLVIAYRNYFVVKVNFKKEKLIIISPFRRIKDVYSFDDIEIIGIGNFFENGVHKKNKLSVYLKNEKQYEYNLPNTFISKKELWGAMERRIPLL